MESRLQELKNPPPIAPNPDAARYFACEFYSKPAGELIPFELEVGAIADVLHQQTARSRFSPPQKEEPPAYGSDDLEEIEETAAAPPVNTFTQELFEFSYKHLAMAGIDHLAVLNAGLWIETEPRALSSMIDQTWDSRSGAGLVFPYYDEFGKLKSYRIRCQNVFNLNEGKKGKRYRESPKYLQPNGCPPQIYIPPNMLNTWGKLPKGKPVYLCEGPKGAMAGWQRGLVSLGLPGIDGWHRSKTLEPLHALKHLLRKRKEPVIAVPDADVETNPLVYDALTLIGHALKELQCEQPAYWAVPQVSAVETKWGFDDILKHFEQRGINPAERIIGDSKEIPEPTEELLLARQSISIKDLDTSDAATLFLEQFTNDDVRLLHYWAGSWWEYIDDVYVSRSGDDIRNRFVKFLDRFVRDTSTTYIGSVMAIIKARCDLSEKHYSNTIPFWVDTVPSKAAKWDLKDCLVTKTQILHMPSKSTIPRTPRLFHTAFIKFDYDPKAPEPTRFLEWLNEDCHPDDPETVENQRRLFRYLLSGDTSQEIIAVYVGPARAGKGTTVRILEALMGEHNVASITAEKLGKDFGLEHLVGKSLGVIDDLTTLDNAMAIHHMKLICSNQQLYINRKGVAGESMYLPTRLLVTSNVVPAFKYSAAAMAARMIIFRYGKTFQDCPNADLFSELCEELPGILKWVIECDDEKVQQSESGKEILELSRSSSNPMELFLTDNCNRKKGKRVEKAVLQEVYNLWANQHNEAIIDNRTAKLFPVYPEGTGNSAFARKLLNTDQTIKSSRVMIDGQRVQFFENVALNSEGKVLKRKHGVPGNESGTPPGNTM